MGLNPHLQRGGGREAGRFKGRWGGIELQCFSTQGAGKRDSQEYKERILIRG